MATGWVISVKSMVISIAVLSTAVILNLSLPLAKEILSELPLLWSVMISWLRPPYLYLVINCIILTIVASSKLQPNKSTAGETECDAGEGRGSVPAKVEVSLGLAGEEENDKFVDDAVSRSPVVFGYVDSPLVRKHKVPQMEPEMMSTEEEAGNRISLKEVEKEKDEFVISRSEWVPSKRENPVEFTNRSVSVEKPLVSTRLSRRKSFKANPEDFKRDNPVEFANRSVSVEKPLVSTRLSRRKSFKANLEGKGALGVSKPRRNDTLETTWRNITEGRPIPLTRHVRKSDTWDTQGRRTQDTSASSTPIHVMRKSETFNDRSSPSPSPGSGNGKMRKEPSLSQDELNRRVEAFINKFNQDMRLQRQQESLNQYWEMVDRRVS